MKLTLDSSALVAALRSLSPVIGTTKTLPVLSCVFLSSGATELFIFATNLNQSMRLETQVAATEPGECVVSHALLLAAASRFPKGELTLTASEGRLELRGKGAMVKLLTLPAEEWPKEEPLTDAATFHLFNAAEDMARLNAFSSTDETRSYLMSVHIGEGVLQACNGHRLIQIPSEAKANCIVPTEAVLLIRQSEQKTMTVEANANLAVFTGENWQMRTKLIEGSFPDAERAKPVLADDCHSLIVNRAALLDAVKLAVSVNENSLYEGAMFSAKDGKLTIRSQSAERGESEATVECVHNHEAEFGMGARNFLTGLAQIPGEEVTLLWGDSTSAITIKGEGYYSLFWQMRLS